MAYPRFQRARSFKVARRTAGNVAVTSTTWVAVDTALDITLNAQVGDVLEAVVSSLWSNDAFQARLEAVTWVSGAAVNTFSGSTYSTTSTGVPGWFGTSGVYSAISGSAFLTVQAGDIVNGLVTVRLLAHAEGTTPAKSLTATATDPLTFAVKNLGPMDPN